MDMSTHSRRSGHRTAVAAVTAVIGLMIAACSSDSPSAQEATSTVVSSTSESTSTAVSTSVAESTTTTTIAVIKATTTTGPKATLADPPLPSSTLPQISIYNPGGLILGPTVKTLTAQKSFTCVQAAQAAWITKVTWTTSGAGYVGLVGSGGGKADWSQKPKPANGSFWVPLACGETTYLKVTPYSASDVAGASKIIAISVASA